MSNFQYPAHLTDPIRKEVAAVFLWREFKKLFPSIKSSDTWNSVYTDILNWHSLEPYPKPIRSFWNDVNAFCSHFKLKDLVPLFTSANVIWQKIDVDSNLLAFNTGGQDFDLIEERPPSVINLVAYYNLPENKILKENAIQKLQKKELESFYEDTDPIIAIKEKEKILILDGNARVLKNALKNTSSYAQSAYLGEVIADPKYKDAWVPTTELIKLVNMYKKSIKEDKENTELANSYAQVISTFVKNSSVAQYELETRCLNMSNPDDVNFIALVRSYLKA